MSVPPNPSQPGSRKTLTSDLALIFISKMILAWWSWRRHRSAARCSWWAQPKTSKVLSDLHRCCLTGGLLPGWPQPPKLQSAGMKPKPTGWNLRTAATTDTLFESYVCYPYSMMWEELEQNIWHFDIKAVERDAYNKKLQRPQHRNVQHNVTLYYMDKLFIFNVVWELKAPFIAFLMCKL